VTHGPFGGAYFATTLARVPLGGGAPREILDLVLWADWTPDGSELAVVKRDGGKQRIEFPIGKVVYETSDELSHVRVSPRGDWLAFEDHEPNAFLSGGALAVVDRSGRRRVLTKDWADLYGIAWRPDGAEVWFTAARKSGELKALYAVTLEGKERLVARMLGQIDLMDIGHDGRVLLTHPSFGSELVALPPGASAERDITWLGLSRVGDLSASGDLVLFTELPEGGATGGFTYLRKTDGSPAVRLGEGQALALSPDGKWALALRLSPSRLVLLPTGVGEAKTLPGSGLTHFSGSWFPDSKRVVFMAESAGEERLYEQAIDGGEPRTIGAPGLGFPRASPDGRVLLARRQDAWVLVAVDGGGPRTCPGVEPEDAPLTWSADGRSLYVARRERLTATIFRVDLGTGRRTRVSEVGARDPAGVDSPEVSVTPDGRAYAYSYFRNLADLYLVDGLK